MNKIAIIILNWNGWKDTIECCSSILQSSINNYLIIIVDNGSTDDSLKYISKWSQGKIGVKIGPFNDENQYSKVKILEIVVNENYNSAEFDKATVALIKNQDNLGFAGGNNIGINFALKCDFKSILLLNNDTTIATDSLQKLDTFFDHNPDIDIITPRINYYDRPDIIWNQGGKLTITGSRKYYGKNKKTTIANTNFCKITFITGCALMARSLIFKEYGLLNEKFFLGEEDYEFSLRMRKQQIYMAAVLTTTIYHKVGVSKREVFKKNILPVAYIFYLNRLINLKSYYPKWYWQIWRLLSLTYIVPMLIIRYKISASRLINFIRLYFKHSTSHDSVTRDDFFNAKEIFQDI